MSHKPNNLREQINREHIGEKLADKTKTPDGGSCRQEQIVSQENGGQSVDEILKEVEKLLDVCAREEAKKYNCVRCIEYHKWKDSRFSG